MPDASGPIEGTSYPESVTDLAPVSLIMIGESTVAGIGAPTHESALTGQTAKAYARRIGRAVNWLALGRSGATARVARVELVPKLKGRTADRVVIAFGVNDSTELNSVKRWTEDIDKLIDDVRKQLGDVKVVISGPPPLESFPAFPSLLRTLLGARSTLLDQALERLVPTLGNVTHAPTIKGLSEEHFCEDKFHPSVAGYAVWGEYLSRYL